jgi:hypothetical protein
MEGDMTSPDRDDLDHAYAQAHALTDDGRGPGASVRANVLAAALQVAAQAAARGAAEPVERPALTPVAAPVSNVARGRLWALNLSSWRVRSGAALGAVLVVALGAWRFDASRRFEGDMQVASAESTVMEAKVVDAPAMDLPPPPPKSLPMPRVSPRPAGASAPPVLGEARMAQAEDHSARDKDLVTVRSDPPYRANSVPPARADARAAHRAPAAALPPTQLAMADPAELVRIDAARPVSPSIGLSAAAPPAGAISGRAVAAFAPPAPTAPAFAAPVATAPVATATAAAASAPDNVVVAALEQQQRVEVTGSSISRHLDAESARGSLEKAKKAAPAPADKVIAGSLRALPTPLHVAAGNNDVDTLHRLLADPATRVDAADAQGRTPLLLAVAARHAAAVRLLLAAGADPDRADSTGATPRSLARTGANAEIATLLGDLR